MARDWQRPDVGARDWQRPDVGARDWQRPVVVAGAGVAGAAAARSLLRRGATVTVIDQRASAATDALAAEGARVVVAPEPPTGLFDGVTDLVVSPGFPPHHPLVAAAYAAGVAVYSEPELAWRLRSPESPAWLAVTGTNGKTTTVTMLAAMLRAAGLRAAAVGNIGAPLVDLTGHEVLAVELSSQQLHWSQTLAPQIGAWLNLADDHLEWHGGRAAYAEAKSAIWRSAGNGGVAVGNLDDPAVAERLPAGGVGFTLRPPAAGQLGVADGALVDRAFGGGELIRADAVRPAGAHNLANALAAAAVALGYGVPATAVAAGLAGYQPEPHRNAEVATLAQVRYVDDSKATNPHAALASLLSYPRVVWVAGGQLKGVAVDELVARVADRLAGAVLLGVDRAELAAALARHAPGVPVREVASTDDGAMAEVVRAAAGLARPGDTVLLAPAAASRDMYVDYAARGAAFVAAVTGLDPAGGAR
ncbi:UDP-N-acetylmuramoyl-L-alanine--D-glutamate ligase [Natronosporangium hydrolyticum]|uniref:UDP-N-acetylmuramoylalanine--D-glutamate ligase n=2 Tax=Natronosporangium hydrolyticum TaxID=2811111 RepID=A0A895YR03_9ACTN|nr:UDP-N-acetylmuramoyl-L-alanine--D-glutamate ligase [Natronosporangium hydrolyticum]